MKKTLVTAVIASSLAGVPTGRFNQFHWMVKDTRQGTGFRVGFLFK